MTTTYYEMAYEQAKGACSVKFLSDQQYCWDISIGRPVAQAWPSDMSFTMRDDRPTNVALVDYISNLESVLLASPRLAAFFRDQKLPDLEFLKVAIIDHKGRVASSDYSIVHCRRVVDCVNQEQSEFDWDGLDTPSMEMRRLVLDEERLGPDDRMIRPRFIPGVILYREDLVAALREQGFSGVGFSRELFGDFEIY